MDKYIEVMDLNEVAALKRKGECYVKKSYHGIVLDLSSYIVPETQYYKLNPNYTEFKEGMLVMVRDYNAEKWIKATYQEFDGSDGTHSCDDNYWIQCRQPTDEEWKVFKNGK